MSVERGRAAIESLIITDDVIKEFKAQPEHREIRPASEFRNALRDSFNPAKPKGDRLPWEKAGDFRFRESELTIWTGYNGHKKSMVLGQVCVGLMAQSRKVCIASFEMTPQQTLRRMYQQYAGTNVLTPEAENRFFSTANDRLWLYQQVKSVKPDNLLMVIRYCAQKLGVKHFVVDSLMRCGISGKDLDKQGWFVDQLATIAMDEGIHIHLVAHQRKPDKTDQGGPGSKYGIAGSSDISNLAHNVINVFQNDLDNSTYANLLTVQKQRNYEGGYTPEPKYKFGFHPESLQFHDQGIMTPADWGVFGGVPE